VKHGVRGERMAIGRISGPLLKANLLREGVDLAFETDLLYLDVNNMRIGIRTDDPTHDLHVNGTTRTTNLEVTDNLDVGDVNFSGNTITGTQGVLNLQGAGSGPVIYQTSLKIDNITVDANIISTNTTNTNLEIRPNGVGTVEVFSDLNVTGNIYASGNITADGNITIGDEDTDFIEFNADIASNLIPDANDTYSLGSIDKRWLNLYAASVDIGSIVTDELIIGGVDLDLRPGKLWYVSTNGADDNQGNHQNDPFGTIGKAITVATAGDTIYVYPGTFTETFPLTVPSGVTIRGAGIRAVTVQPSLATQDLDAFLMNGETTIEDLTVTGFKYNIANNTGYAFRFAPNFTVTNKSPYVRNITVITRGSVTSESDPYGFDSNDAGKGIFLDGSVATASSKEASMLFSSVTFITPNQEALTATNGVRVEWLNSFSYFADIGMYLYSGTTGFAGQGKTQLRLSNTTSTFNVGNTVTYYDTDGTTVLATGTIASKDADGKLYITGKQVGFETAADRGGKTITANGDAKLSTAVKKFGTASLALDGTGDYAFVQSNADFGYGTGDFTIEMWVYRTVSGITQVLLDQRTANPTNYAPVIFINTSNALQYNDGAASVITGATTVPLNAWSHVAASRSGTSTRLFLNGVQQGTTYTDTRTYIANPLTIGARFNNTQNFTGYIDDLRISKGIARYTSNFTAPISIVPNDSSTVLLARFDGTDNSTTFVDETVLIQDIRSSSGGTAQFITLADYSEFGAEVRSIGSASVYGNYGVYGDGLGVVAYLIGQNLAYIGTGKRSDNDTTYVVQDNEIVELNGARLYYSSVDHKGDFRIGDLFYVNQEDGTVNFTTASFNVSSTSGLTFTNAGGTTYIDGSRIDTGNLRLSGNTFESLTGAINITSADDQINFTNNVNVAGNVAVVGNVTIGGNITIGDASTDSVNFIAAVNSNIIPNIDSTYNLGSEEYQWNQLWTDETTIADINISSNTITTVTSNTNLILEADGAGIISIPTNNVVIDQNLTLNDTAYLTDLDITGTVDQTGTVTQTGDYIQTGDTDITGNLTVSTWAQFEDIRIETNTISTTVTDSDLTLAAAGTGRIYVPSDNVQFDQDLTVDGVSYLATVDVTGTVTANAFTTGDVFIDDNYITTTVTNSNLELRADGTGKIYVPSNDVQFDQNLTVNGTTTLSTTGTTLDVTGTITQVGAVTQTGDYTQTGNINLTGNLTVSSYAQFTDIRLDGNTVSTTVTDSDLNLQANGTGRIFVPSNNVQIDNDLTVNGSTFFNTVNVTGTVTANAFSTGNVFIDDNYITTTVTNSNLELRADGTGKILVPTNNFEVTNNLTVTTGTTTLKDTGITGTITHTGNVTQTGDIGLTGNHSMTGTLTVGSTAQFEDVRIDNNTITTTLSNNDLELAAAGTGRIYVPSNNVRFDQNLSVGGTTTTANINSSGTVTANTFTTGDVTIVGNQIYTTLTNSNLELRAAGTGLVRVEQLDIQENEIRTNTNADIVLAPNGTGIVNVNSNQSIKLPVGTTSDRPNPASAGMVRFNTSLSRYEGFDGTNWIRLDGLYDLDENTYVTAELTPGANDNTFRFVSNGVQIADLNSTRLNVIDVNVDSININNNQITTTASNTDLVLQTTGTGSLRIGNFAFRTNIITNTVNNSVTEIVQTGDSYFKIGGTNGFVIPSGRTDQRPGQLEVGMTRFNTTDGRLEIYNGLIWISAAGTSVGISAAEAADITILNVLMLG
jgi:Concanavalin A-like lectin/glucanases superfamily